MFTQTQALSRLLLLTAIVFSGFTLVDAQDKTETVVVSEPKVMGVGTGIRRGDAEDDDSKVTGATLRGRLIYEDSGRPVRYALISLAREDIRNGAFYSGYSAKYVKTDENGDFVIKNVSEGSYYPIVKVEGVLNIISYRAMPGGEEKGEKVFEKITVAGLGEFSVVIMAKRGGAISGRVHYSDGEAAVGVKVEALRKTNERFVTPNNSYGEVNVGTATTDDRGAYRFAGLPVGQYIVRVVEPVSHKPSKAEYSYSYSESGQSSVLRTYFPSGEKSQDAKQLEVALGQEQGEINITLPDRQLFSISGRVFQKKDQQPLKNFTVFFQKISDMDTGVMDFAFSGNSNYVNSDKDGNWTLKSLPKGKYRLRVSQPSFYLNDEDRKKTPSYPNIVKEIELSDKDVRDVLFEMPLESGISGTIVVEGEKDVPNDLSIYAFNEETREVATTARDAQTQAKNPPNLKQRAFRIGKLASGKYRINIGNRSYYLKSATLDGKDLMNSPIEVSESEEIKDVLIVLANDFGTLKGKVENFDPKVQTFVVLLKTSASQSQSMTPSSSFSIMVKPNGEFEVKAAPGEYLAFTITANNRPKNAEEAKTWRENLTKDAPKVTIKANETATLNLSIK